MDKIMNWCRRCKKDNIVRKNFRRGKNHKYVTVVICLSPTCKAQYMEPFDASVGWVETEEVRKEDNTQMKLKI